MLPTLTQLRYLKLLDEHRSFSRAAEAAHVTQPTLSAGMQALERTLGVQLVDRSRSGVILTAAGTETAARARAVLAQTEDLVRASSAAGAPLSGRFRLGVIPTIAPFLLPRALPALRRDFPQLRLFLREDLTHRLTGQLAEGTLDAAVVALPWDLAGLDHAPICEDELLAALPPSHPMANAERVAPERLGEDELILLEDGHCLRDHILASCNLGRGQGREEAFAATSLSTLVQMVGSGLGVSFLPAMAVQAGLAESAHVTVRPLAADGASRRIVVAWRAGSSRERDGRLLAGCFAGACA